MKNLRSEILSSIEERFQYEKIETTREHKQTLYLDTEYIDTSETKRYLIVTPNQIHSFFEICLYQFREQKDAVKYVRDRSTDPGLNIRKELSPIITLWFYFKADENGKHETVVFDTLISPNSRMHIDIHELAAYIEKAFLDHEEKQMQLNELRQSNV